MTTSRLSPTFLFNHLLLYIDFKLISLQTFRQMLDIYPTGASIPICLHAMVVRKYVTRLSEIIANDQHVL